MIRPCPTGPGETPEETSPLGRYGLGGTVDAPLMTVRLLGTPLELFAAAREWHDSVMAELRSRALNPQTVPAGTPARLVELTDVLGVQYATAAPRPDAEVDTALDAGERRRDLTYRVPRQAATAAQMLADLLAEVDDFCAAGLLLTEPRGPELRSFTVWWTEQFRRQCRGEDPVRWDGPLDLPALS